MNSETMVLGIDIGIKTFSFCIYNGRNIIKLETHDLLPNAKAKHLAPDRAHALVKRVFSKILTQNIIESIHYVFIERMPIRATRFMWLFTHLIFYELSKYKPVQFVMGKKKFELYEYQHIYSLFNLKKYNERKKASVLILKESCQKNDEMIKKIQSEKKIDDIADAYLISKIGFSILKKKNPQEPQISNDGHG